ncbi:hypothetical protein [Plantactinospora sonchi]|uniref:PknH-like extracellular domain-containing protein n=1 Tax=Plantactinospora sonchi TaxID=1544735 RepID=A0ABU7RSZ8_9ACTN
MHDREAALVERLNAELVNVRWSTAEEIRGRARRRTLIRLVVGAFASVVLLGTGTAAIATLGPAVYDVPALPGGDVPTTSPVRSTTALGLPSPASPGKPVPEEALLQPVDVGAGLVVDRVNTGRDEPVTLLDPATLNHCPAFTRSRFDTVYAQQYRRHTVQQPPTVYAAPETGEPVVHEEVYRVSVDDASRILADVHRIVTDCDRFVSTGSAQSGTRVIDVEAEHHWAVLGERLGGDESLLIEHRVTVRSREPDETFSDSDTYLMAVIRLGDLVALIQPVDTDRDRARELASAAAARLCLAAIRGC